MFTTAEETKLEDIPGMVFSSTQRLKNASIEGLPEGKTMAHMHTQDSAAACASPIFLLKSLSRQVSKRYFLWRV